MNAGVPGFREAVTVPLLLLTVAALGGVRVGPSGALALVPPSLMALLLATLLLAALVRSGTLAPGSLVNDRRATLAYEAFAAGSTVNWAFWHDEVHVITGGEAKVTYTLGPNHRKQVTKTFRKGDTYLIPNGARVRFEVAPGAPYLHVCVIMPRFEFSKDERLDNYN